MELVRAKEVEGAKVEVPYSRRLKYLLGPDRGNVQEMSFNFALIDPGNGTDYHTHDRPELIYIVSGKGEAICDGKPVDVEDDTILWVRADEKHQMTNKGEGILKLATMFIPPYSEDRTYGQCLERREQEMAKA